MEAESTLREPGRIVRGKLVSACGLWLCLLSGWVTFIAGSVSWKMTNIVRWKLLRPEGRPSVGTKIHAAKMGFSKILGGMMMLAGMDTAIMAEKIPDIRDRMSQFENQLFVHDGNGRTFKQRPEAEQRPMVAAFFATLTTPKEKFVFIEMGASGYRYIYAINETVFVDFVLKLLRDDDATVRVAAIHVLRNKGLHKHDEDVAKLLGDPDPAVRVAAIEELTDKHADQVMLLLDDPDPKVRGKAMVWLGWFRRHDLVPRLAKIASSAKDMPDRMAAIEGIGALIHDKSSTAEQRAEELAIVTSYLDVQAVAQARHAALGVMIEVPEVAEFLGVVQKLTASDDANTRLQCVRVLGVIEGDAATAALKERLHDSSPNVRRAATSALAAMPPYPNSGRRRPATREAAADVAKLLEDPDAPTRGEAVNALLAMGALEYADAIAMRLNDEDASVQMCVLEALATFTSQKNAPHIVTVLHSVNAGVRLKAVMTLIKIGTKEQAAAVAELADDPDKGVRAMVLRFLREQRAAERPSRK